LHKDGWYSSPVRLPAGSVWKVALGRNVAFARNQPFLGSPWFHRTMARPRPPDEARRARRLCGNSN
jgi:hypothetical protein